MKVGAQGERIFLDDMPVTLSIIKVSSNSLGGKFYVLESDFYKIKEMFSDVIGISRMELYAEIREVLEDKTRVIKLLSKGGRKIDVKYLSDGKLQEIPEEFRGNVFDFLKTITKNPKLKLSRTYKRSGAFKSIIFYTNIYNYAFEANNYKLQGKSRTEIVKLCNDKVGKIFREDEDGKKKAIDEDVIDGLISRYRYSNITANLKLIKMYKRKRKVNYSYDLMDSKLTSIPGVITFDGIYNILMDSRYKDISNKLAKFYRDVQDIHEEYKISYLTANITGGVLTHSEKVNTIVLYLDIFKLLDYLGIRDLDTIKQLDLRKNYIQYDYIIDRIYEYLVSEDLNDIGGYIINSEGNQVFTDDEFDRNNKSFIALKDLRFDQVFSDVRDIDRVVKENIVYFDVR